MTIGPEVTEPAEVTLSLEAPARQRRWTVAIRYILAIPHFLYAGVLGYVVWFALIAAWIAALFVARVPAGLATFLSRIIQYTGRVYAYGYLLMTDRYPSFALDEPEYPISIEVPEGQRLNRFAVFFRAILLVPVLIVLWIVGVGMAVTLPFVWLIVLVAGRMPNVLFEAIAAVLRYGLRVYAFAAMLTSEYPRRLFGDRGVASDEPAPVTDATAPPMFDPALPPARPRITRLVLSRAAKRIVALFVVLGVIFGTALIVVAAMNAGEADRARRELAADYDDLRVASERFGRNTQRCALTSGGPGCVHDAVRDLRDAFAVFRGELRAIEMPGSALANADRLEDDTSRIIGVLDRMAATSDPAEYEALAGEFQQLAGRFDDDYVVLHDQLLLNA